MENPIKRIVKFNQDAGLIEGGYDDFLESSFQIEEALEGFSFVHELGIDLNLECTDDDRLTPKDVSRAIVSRAIATLESLDGTSTPETLQDVDRLDKACDAVIFAVGSMSKLGLNAQQITQALNIVIDANQAKLKCPKDEFGKIIKPIDFVGPEPKLQALLDKRG